MKLKWLALGLLLLSLTACGTATTSSGMAYDLPETTVEEPEAVVEEVAVQEDVELPEEIEAPAEASVVELPDLDSGEESSVLEIGEKMFITQINDIYYNFQDYADKTIIVEGMYTMFASWDGESAYPGVYRLGPGCCGNDGWGGFMLYYDGELPQDNDWIRVTGTPELVEDEDGYTSLFLNVTSLTIQEERGAEFVLQ